MFIIVFNNILFSILKIKFNNMFYFILTIYFLFFLI